MNGPAIVEGKQLAVIGDKVVCSCQGGPHKIVSGAPTADLYGVPIARVGDKSSCGATITTGTSKFTIRGMQAALHGSQTSCGGQVVTGTGSAPSHAVPTRYNERLRILDPRGNPIANHRYVIIRPDGSQVRGVTDAQGVTNMVRDHESPETLKIFVSLLGRQG